MDRITLSAVIASLTLAAAAHADFVPAEWTVSSSGVDPNEPEAGGIAIAPDKMLLTEPDQGPDGAFWLAEWSYTGGGTISFDWSVVISADPGFGSFGYLINGNYTSLSTGSFGGGSVVLNLNAGDVFAFRVNTVDGIFGQNAYSVTSFVPAPGALALLGMAGVTGARRRRR